MLEIGSKSLRLLLGAALIFQSSGCGTIMYPERKGQKAGKIDLAVAALDAVGLLFFIIPGVIAFAVDFNNGSIYLPKDGQGLLNHNEIEKLEFDPGADAKASLETILLHRTGRRAALASPGLEVFEMKSLEEIPERFASAY